MIQNILHRHRHLPDDLWVQCPGCHQLIYRREYQDNLQTCAKCGHHARLSAAERIAMLVDPDSWGEEDAGLMAADPLEFVSLGQSYTDKAAETRAKTGLDEALLTGHARIEDVAVRLAVCDFAFFGASMGSVMGEKVALAAERSAQDRLPLVMVVASGGARMHEGIYSLMQMAKTSAALIKLGEAKVPCISILTDPTTGGVTASFASLGDIIFAEQGALIGFAGPRVIEQTTKQRLPPGAQRPDFLLQHGMIDDVVHRRELRAKLAMALRLIAPSDRSSSKPKKKAPSVNGHAALKSNGDAPSPPALPARAEDVIDPWDVVQRARDGNRPFTLDYVGMVFSDFIELHGDRQYADDPAIVAGIGSLDGRSVAIVGHQKGRTTQERLDRRFGMARPEGYRKALRVMLLAEKFGFPIVTFIDTPGADPSLEAEQRGQAWAIAENLAEMVQLEVPVISIVIGEGGSGGALAIGVADRLLMLENATYSVVSPEGCASILWNDAALAAEAARAMRITAVDVSHAGIADGIVIEPAEGAQADYVTAGAAVKDGILGALKELDGRFGRGKGLDSAALLAARYKKYREIGEFTTSAHPAPSTAG